MSDAFYVGAVALQAQQRALDGIANNIANVNTPAFKRVQVRFADVVASRAADVLPADALRADTTFDTAGVMLDSQFMLNEPGQIERTGKRLDLAIDGAGFIELMGPAGQSLLWRGGTLRVNEDGQLATSSGIALKAAITVPADATGLSIGHDGVVRATVPDTADAVELGQIQLVKIADPSKVARLDGGIYRMEDASLTTEAVAGEDGAGTFVQGALEQSNVALTDEMVRLMLVQRAYAANAQIVQAADQLMGIANGLRR
ncbi:flagellar hook-basal body protein [Sphingomonas elodea]|uniref:flagellar hook-basal body protein n=1 Tax=Sphingomonas elodea TaxID=179878 RepID=UPI0002631388|nr:flagellar hook-basal body protein [Sphingomonas elodea]